MARFKDLTGQQFGEWTVLYRAESRISPSGRKETMWHCRCSCGTERDVSAANITDGSSSCGCVGRKKTSEMFSKDLTGQKFGRLTAIKRIAPDHSKRQRTRYECLCDCGNIVTVLGGGLTDGQTKSCGCYNREQAAERFTKDITGEKFGRLTVLGPGSHKGEKLLWRCRCECGTEKEIDGQALRNGTTRSCGCLKKDLARQNLMHDLTGQRFGSLVVVSQADDIVSKAGRSYIAWNCQCDCGNMTVATSELLKSGKKVTCGCSKSRAEDRTGKSIMTRSGLRATIIDGEKAKDMTVQFEDGVIKEHVSYDWFIKGVVAHPNWGTKNPKGNVFLCFTDVKLSYRMLSGVYYQCRTPEGDLEIMSPQDMIAYAREHQNAS